MDEKIEQMCALVAELNKVTDAYNNGGTELMTDFEWDSMFDRLKVLEKETGIVLPESPTNRVSIDNGVGQEVTDELVTVSTRNTKGTSLIALPNDYVVVDLETTGLSPYYDEIIECAALRVRDGKIVDEFQSLVCPSRPICEFIIQLTGITNDMLEGQPNIKVVLPRLLDFIGNDIVLGHNVGFDVNFIYDAAKGIPGCCFKNDFVNTLRVAKKAIPALAHYRLSDLCEYYSIDSSSAHRALEDCKMTFEVYQRMRGVFTSEAEFQSLFKRVSEHKRHYNKLDARIIESEVPEDEIDKSNPLYGKEVVFTGPLERFPRRIAMQIVANLGGHNANGVTRTVDYLVVGGREYHTDACYNKSAKRKKAERYALEGTGIAIIDENTFYDMIEDEE